MDIKKRIVIILAIVLVIPIIVYALSVIPVIPSGNNDWAGFWGGYLGSIIGGVITLYVMSHTLKDNANIRDRAEKVDYFDKIISVTAEYCQANGNMSRSMSISFNGLNIQSFDSAINAANLSSRMRAEFGLLLETRKEIYDLEEAIIIFGEVEEYSEKIAALYNRIANEALSNRTEPEFDEYIEINTIFMLKLPELEKTIRETVRKNLFGRKKRKD